MGEDMAFSGMRLAWNETAAFAILSVCLVALLAVTFLALRRLWSRDREVDALRARLSGTERTEIPRPPTPPQVVARNVYLGGAPDPVQSFTFVGSVPTTTCIGGALSASEIEAVRDLIKKVHDTAKAIPITDKAGMEVMFQHPQPWEMFERTWRCRFVRNTPGEIPEPGFLIGPMKPSMTGTWVGLYETMAHAEERSAREGKCATCGGTGKTQGEAARYMCRKREGVSVTQLSIDDQFWFKARRAEGIEPIFFSEDGLFKVTLVRGNQYLTSGDQATMGEAVNQVRDLFEATWGRKPGGCTSCAGLGFFDVGRETSAGLPCIRSVKGAQACTRCGGTGQA
jgi:hypothetical protein